MRSKKPNSAQENLKNCLGDNHKKPITRRDFLSFTKDAATGIAFMPSVMALISARAYGQDCASIGGNLSSMIPVFVYDAAGGAAWMEDVVAGGEGGQTDFIQGTGAYENFGIPDDLNYNAAGITPDASFGLAFHPQAAFLQGIKETLPQAFWPAVDGFVVANRSNSDSRDNYLATTHYFARYGRTGRLINVAGSNTDAGGGRHRPALNSITPETSPVRVGSTDAARRVAGTGQMVTDLGEEKARAVLKAIENMSRSKIEKFNNLSFDQQIQTLVNCGYINSVDLPFQLSPDDIFPSSIPGGDNLVTAFGGDSNSQLAAMAKLILDHNAGISVFEAGGYDNHNGSNQSPGDQRLRTGRRIGQVIHYAALRNQPVFCIITTDGSMGVSRGMGGVVQTDDTASQMNGDGTVNTLGGRGFIRHPGDNDNVAGQFVLAYIPGSQRGDLVVSSNRQVGAFNRFGVRGDYLITAGDTTRTAQVILYNYLALHGMESQITQVDGGRNPFGGANAAAYLKFKKVT